MDNIVFLSISARGSTALLPPSSTKWAAAGAMLAKSIHRMGARWSQHLKHPPPPLFFLKHKYFYFWFGKRHFCVILCLIRQGPKHHKWTTCPVSFCVIGRHEMLQEYLKLLARCCLLQSGMANRI